MGGKLNIASISAIRDYVAHANPGEHDDIEDKTREIIELWESDPQHPTIDLMNKKAPLQESRAAILTVTSPSSRHPKREELYKLFEKYKMLGGKVRRKHRSKTMKRKSRTMRKKSRTARRQQRRGTPRRSRTARRQQKRGSRTMRRQQRRGTPRRSRTNKRNKRRSPSRKVRVVSDILSSSYGVKSKPLAPSRQSSMDEFLAGISSSSSVVSDQGSYDLDAWMTGKKSKGKKSKKSKKKKSKKSDTSGPYHLDKLFKEPKKPKSKKKRSKKRSKKSGGFFGFF